MKRKTDLEKYKIEYARQKYNIDLYGMEDPGAKDGLWDLAGKCAEIIVDILDYDCKLFATDNESQLARATAQEEIYRLIKFYMLRPLDQQLNNQKQM